MPTAAKPSKELLRNVVKVYTVSDAPDYEQPWQTQGPESASGSGVVVRTKKGLRVLTNGHVVENNVFAELRRYGVAQKFVAEVEGLGHTCDLALLRVAPVIEHEARQAAAARADFPEELSAPDDAREARLQAQTRPVDLELQASHGH